MPFRFKKHYSVAEAEALLPRVREWLQKIEHLRGRITQLEQRVNALLASGGDVGGESANENVRCLADLKSVLDEFQRREILLKDVGRGLIDFPALRDGREVFLCWENGEETIEHWHDLETGFAGREPL